MKRGDLHPLGAMMPKGDLALITIKPPGQSFAEWDRFLGECHEAGLLDLVRDEPPKFHSMFGRALLKRWRWLQNARARAMTYQQAEQAWEAAMERDNAAIVASMAENDRRRAAASNEREGLAKALGL